MTDYLNVGKIVNTQGIKGEVRVISKTDFPEERYQKGATLLLFQEKKAPIELVVKSHRKHKNFDILSFEGHPNINDVEKYRDGILKVAKDNLAELAEDEFYYHQIVVLLFTMKPVVNWEKLKKFYLLVRMMYGSSNDQRKKIYFYRILKALLQKSMSKINGLMWTFQKD